MSEETTTAVFNLEVVMLACEGKLSLHEENHACTMYSLLGFSTAASCSRCIGCQCWVDRNSISYQRAHNSTRVSVLHVPCQLAITKSCFSGHTICRTLCALLLYFLLSIIQLIIIAGIEICSTVLKNSPKKYPFTKIDEF